MHFKNEIACSLRELPKDQANSGIKIYNIVSGLAWIGDLRLSHLILALNFHAWNSFELESAWLDILRHIICLFPYGSSCLYRCTTEAKSALEFNGLLKDATFSPLYINL